MKSEIKKELKEKFVELYLQGKTMQEIAKLCGCSRNFVGQVIKDDERVKRYKDKKSVRVYKYKNQHKMSIPISVNFLKKIGISDDLSIIDFVDIVVDESNKTITIKKSDS